MLNFPALLVVLMSIAGLSILNSTFATAGFLATIIGSMGYFRRLLFLLLLLEGMPSWSYLLQYLSILSIVFWCISIFQTCTRKLQMRAATMMVFYYFETLNNRPSYLVFFILLNSHNFQFCTMF